MTEAYERTRYGRKIARYQNERRIRNTRTGHLDPAYHVQELYVTAEMVEVRASYLEARGKDRAEVMAHLVPLIGRPVAVLFQ